MTTRAEVLSSRLGVWLPWIGFVFAALILLFGNGSHALWDRDEPRNATASRNMIWTGDWVTPSFNGELRAHKPVLVNWTQAAAMRVLGATEVGPPGMAEFAVRLPSAMAGALTVAITLQLALYLGLGVFGALIVGAVVLASPLFLMVHKAATTDGILIAATWWAISIWIRQHRGFCWYRHSAFGVALAITVLQKGPVGLLLLALLDGAERLVVWRRGEGAMRLAEWPAAWKRHVITSLWIFGLCLPWVVAVHISTDGAFLREALGRHVVQRAAGSGVDGHDGPIFFYVPVLLLMVLFTLPLVARVLPVVWQSVRPEHRLYQVLGTWCLLVVIAFSLFRTKLPHYILPILPAIGMITAGFWVLCREQLTVGPWKVWGQVFYGVAALIGVCVCIAAFVVPMPEVLVALRLPVGALGLLLVVWAVVCWTFWSRWLVGSIVGATLLALPLVFAVAFGGVLAALEPHRASPKLAAQVKRFGPGVRLGAVGYQEPSLVWYHGEEVRMMGRRRPWPAVEFLNQPDRSLVIVEKKVYDKWTEETTATLPAPAWSGQVLNLQSEVFSELYILDSATTSATNRKNTQVGRTDL